MSSLIVCHDLHIMMLEFVVEKASKKIKIKFTKYVNRK